MESAGGFAVKFKKDDMKMHSPKKISKEKKDKDESPKRKNKELKSAVDGFKIRPRLGQEKILEKEKTLEKEKETKNII
jgi:hypothetical protein